MRKALTLVAVCGLALGVAACGKSGGNDSANMSSSDNMLVPADENSADAGMTNDAGAMAGDNAGMMDNSAGAMSNDMAGNMSGNAQ